MGSIGFISRLLLIPKKYVKEILGFPYFTERKMSNLGPLWGNTIWLAQGLRGSDDTLYQSGFLTISETSLLQMSAHIWKMPYNPTP